ncbi:hypothetical protein BpHYR1_035721 [Brachionus plicatilis]|uniref:Uncharacterized protein n=1 Tax=Brachionus plicatilis TaxID=10195 RepID=A0A3M7Q7T5_BRAPC|nr:hypothetical protein BpHYR1_035721 [Brachionus plicatilis]
MNPDRQVSLQHNGAATKRTAERENTFGNKQRGTGRPRKIARREEIGEEDFVGEASVMTTRLQYPININIRLYNGTPGEHFEQWLAEFKTKTSRIDENSQMVKKAYPMITDPLVLEKLKLENFLRGLSHDLAVMVRERKPTDLQEGLRFAEICEVDKGTKKKEQLFVNEIKPEKHDSEGGDKQRINQSTSKADTKKNNDSKNLENNLSTLYHKINKQIRYKPTLSK